MENGLKNMKIYGFDSFYGLPDNWRDADMEQGQFNRRGEPPLVSPNVRLIQGLFNETLDKFILRRKNKLKIKMSSISSSPSSSTQPPSLFVDYVNVDNDLYEGTLFILNRIGPYLQRLVLVFVKDNRVYDYLVY